MQARELTTFDQKISAYQVLKHMYPGMSLAEYKSFIKIKQSSNYRMLGVYDDGELICVSGFWIDTRLYCGKFIQIDNMVTSPEHRSKQAGKVLLDTIKKIGQEAKCNKVILDSYVENFAAHRFFYREGFIIRGYHLNLDL